METIIKEAGSLIGKLGTYARLIIVGVWFPGFLIFCELGSSYFRLFGPHDIGLASYVAGRIKAFDSAIVSTFIVVGILATSIALGYIARDVTFAISDLWIRRGWRPTRRLSVIFTEIRHVYGEDSVNNIASTYSVFRLASGEVGVSSLPRLPETYVREFCKLWLRLKQPRLNTEGLEIEINMVMGLVMPVALSSMFSLSFIGLWPGIIFASVSIVAATFMMYRINWARNIETEQAIVNFLFAHWAGLGVGYSGAPAENSGSEQKEL